MNDQKINKENTMNTLLISAWEALELLARRDFEDPQLDKLTAAMQVIWICMEDDERNVLSSRKKS